MAQALNQMVGPAERANDIIEGALNSFENQGHSYEPVREKRCIRVTPSTAPLIRDVLKKCNCNHPDFTPFKDEMTPEAIRSILTERKITKVTFAISAQETEAVKVAREVARRRALEIAFA